MAAREKDEALNGQRIHCARRPMWRETRTRRSGESTDEAMR